MIRKNDFLDNWALNKWALDKWPLEKRRNAKNSNNVLFHIVIIIGIRDKIRSEEPKLSEYQLMNPGPQLL